jgi:LacI family transcriptional regulator
MARRPRLTDIAREAGVSLATVDRVLNGREQVRADTVARVTAAIGRLGYHPALHVVRPEQDRPAYRFGILLHKAGQEFYQTFARELALVVAASTGPKAQLVLEFATSQAPSEVARLMHGFAGRVDVLAATAVNHPEVTSAVSDLKAKGLPVFALLSDFAQGVRQGYVGLNNHKVGRIAGWMVAMAARRPGKVAVFVGGHRWQGHELRDAGFRDYLREIAPTLDILDTFVNLETRQLTYDATLALLACQPDLCAIYVAGGGMEGAIAALREQRMPGEVVLVVNELTADSRAGLAEGWVTLVDATPLPALSRDLIGLMARAAQSGVSGPPGQYFLPPVLHVAESI